MAPHRGVHQGRLTLLPDADVIGFRFGIRYEDVWGHRGATHSFRFAPWWGWWSRRLRGRSPAGLRTGFVAAAVVASHALFDTLTDGGLGCALLWPFSDARFFAPWSPLPVAPIGRHFVSIEGLRVAALELLMFSPFLLYTLWPARTSVPVPVPVLVYRVNTRSRINSAIHLPCSRPFAIAIGYRFRRTGARRRPRAPVLEAREEWAGTPETVGTSVMARVWYNVPMWWPPRSTPWKARAVFREHGVVIGGVQSALIVRRMYVWAGSGRRCISPTRSR